MDDITEQMDGFVAPSEAHIEQVLNFVRGWDRGAPLVVHCYAGISRSTASAFAAVCALNPDRDEIEIAKAIRAASPIASPNRPHRRPCRPGARGATAACCARSTRWARARCMVEGRPS